MPAYTIGLLAFVPALHAAIQLQRRDLWRWAAALGASDLLVWILAGTSSASDTTTTPLEGFYTLLAVGLAAVGTARAFRLHDAVFGTQAEFAPEAPSAAPKDDPAVRKSLADRQRRARSISLVANDPGMARDLRIGRPDLTKEYDDGGLVDVNHVPEAVLVSHLGLSRSQARSVVSTRDDIDGFENVDDLIVMANLPPKALDAVRDRIVTL